MDIEKAFAKAVVEELERYFNSEEDIKEFIENNDLDEELSDQFVSIGNHNFRILTEDEAYEIAESDFVNRYYEALSLLEDQFYDIYKFIDGVISIYSYFKFDPDLVGDYISSFDYNYETYYILLD